MGMRKGNAPEFNRRGSMGGIGHKPVFKDHPNSTGVIEMPGEKYHLRRGTAVNLYLIHW
jgi:hypothetical protein